MANSPEPGIRGAIRGAQDRVKKPQEATIVGGRMANSPEPGIRGAIRGAQDRKGFKRVKKITLEELRKRKRIYDQATKGR